MNPLDESRETDPHNHPIGTRRVWPGLRLDPLIPLHEPEGGAHGWIQWKGTEVCMDIHCACGILGHIDGEFVYSVGCMSCGRKYAVGQNVKLIELNTPELLAANERYHADYHEFGDKGTKGLAEPRDAP